MDDDGSPVAARHTVSPRPSRTLGTDLIERVARGELFGGLAIVGRACRAGCGHMPTTGWRRVKDAAPSTWSTVMSCIS